MNSLQKTLDKTVRVLSEAAGWLLALCMQLITMNVILRKVFGKPMLGTYEWVGILTALTISLGLAFCEQKGAHITIDFLADKLCPSVRKVVSAITGVFSITIMTVVFYSIFRYAFKLLSSGEVSPTTRIPFYIFVFMTGFGFVFLTLTLLLKTIMIFRGEKR